MSPVLEAPYVLNGPLAAGTYSLVGDAMVFNTPDVEYDVIWRQAGDGGVSGHDGAAGDAVRRDGGWPGDAGARIADRDPHDTVIASFHHRFTTPAQPPAGQYRDSVTAPAVSAKAGDELVLRIVLLPDSPAQAEFVPYGDVGTPVSSWITLAIP